MLERMLLPLVLRIVLSLVLVVGCGSPSDDSGMDVAPKGDASPELPGTVDTRDDITAPGDGFEPTETVSPQDVLSPEDAVVPEDAAPPEEVSGDLGTDGCEKTTCEALDHTCGEWPDGCGGVLDCGTCDAFANAWCNEGQCDCAPDCFDKACGSDGCGGSCGPCVCGNGLCEETEDPVGCAPDCGPCGDGVCGADEQGAGSGGEPLCAKDCSPVCGDGVCESGESNATCPYDCSQCGDGICSPGEEGTTCFFECAFGCGDGQCGGLMESSKSCPQDCPAQCGDGLCAPPETVQSCPQDCGKCGDGVCADNEAPEGCPADCTGLCGNGLCEGTEQPDGCPADCGACGDGTCGFLESPESCPADCAPTCGNGTCEEEESAESCPPDCGCLPDCSGKECGLDDCGFDCGSCEAFASCGEDHQCHCDALACGGVCCSPEAICFQDACCVPTCSGVECGSDGCGGSCGSCPDLETCNAGSCVCQFETCGDACCQSGQSCFQGSCCTPQCGGKECGDDGCGGSCGSCGFAHECEAGQCVWQVFCGNGLCEPDAGEDCQSCDADCNCGNGAICLEDGSCCPLQCAGKECGPDGCGGECGDCQALSTCTDGLCICDFEACGATCCPQGEVCHQGACCLPQCDGKECGDDGCGGTCGDCSEGFSCVNGLCQCDNILWSRTHGDKKTDIIYSVSPAADGYYITGRTETLLDYHNFWVAKTSADGYKQWSKDFTGSGSFSTDIAFASATTPEGDVVAVGKQDTGLWYSGVARKLGPDGTSIWGKSFGGNGLNEFRDVVVSDAGTYVMVGQTFSGYTYKGWLVELDANGNQKSSKVYQASGAFDVLRGITKVSGGGYLAVGCSGLQSIDNEDYVSPGSLWLLRLDASFNQVWSAKPVGSSEGFSVAETADGFIAVGYQYSGGNRNVVVVRTDASGSKLWDQVFGWSKDDVARDVLTTPKGTFLVTGYATPPDKTDQDLLLFEMSGAGAILWQSFLGGSSTQAGYALLPFTGEAGKYLVGGKTSSDGWLLKVGTCY